jgi:hypothetical protein
MASDSTKKTTDHATIRQWVEERGGHPAMVKGTGSQGEAGVLRIEFPGYSNSNSDSLKEISWDEFFNKFDEKHLAFLYQDEMRSGQESRFSKFVSRDGG